MDQKIVPYGLFEENKLMKFNVTNNFQSSSIFELKDHSIFYPEIHVTETKEVQCYRLDSLIQVSPSYLPWHDFDFINVDTQGAELAVLKGLGLYLNQGSIKGVYLEVNERSLYENIPLVDEIDTFMRQHGFARLVSHWTDEGWGDALYLKCVVSKKSSTR